MSDEAADCSSDDSSSPDEYGEKGGEDFDIDEAQELRDQLRDVPLGEIKKLKDKVGLHKYNQVLFGATSNEGEFDESEFEANKHKRNANQRHDKNKNVAEEKKKKAKSEPEEMSSKKRKFSKPRHVVKNDKRSVRDPRFSDLSGHFNDDLFQKSFSFIQDMKKNEYDEVKKQLKKVKGKEQKEDLLRLKQKMDNERNLEVEKEKRRELNKERKSKQSEQTKEGKRPFYLKNSDKKKIELAEKYRELKASGRLEKFMSKKRKRNAQKDRKNLPNLKGV